jgi:hypothetical protein
MIMSFHFHSSKLQQVEVNPQAIDDQLLLVDTTNTSSKGKNKIKLVVTKI